ncbi:hypothetical protein QWZ10_24465 [Paracoccus cavernae]|uniref:Uncharacterized protein n=1 Tax=Paracoccus cavernae TaxID=1571207 RepID=A0ABT8DEM0_9RHOB|nr:hypothetical protein [Paracoccus cavernae]
MTITKLIPLAVLTAVFSGPVLAEEFDLDALIKAAQAEEGINVVDSTGKIVDMAESFSKKYGVKAVGTKSKATAQLESVVREAQSGNVQGDVVMISDVPAAMGQLLPEGFASSWVPPDLAGISIPRRKTRFWWSAAPMC